MQASYLSTTSSYCTRYRTHKADINICICANSPLNTAGAISIYLQVWYNYFLTKQNSWLWLCQEWNKNKGRSVQPPLPYTSSILGTVCLLSSRRGFGPLVNTEQFFFFLLITDIGNWELYKWYWLAERIPAFLIPFFSPPGLHTPPEEKARLCWPFQGQVALEQVSKPTLENILEKQTVKYLGCVNPVHTFSHLALMLLSALELPDRQFHPSTGTPCLTLVPLVSSYCSKIHISILPDNPIF